MLNDLLERLFPWKTRPSSREEVKQRLKLVLAYDRAGISPGMLNAMRNDILTVVSRYVEIDDEQLEFAIENSDRSTALIANFPIRRIKSTADPEPETYASEEQSALIFSSQEEEAELEELFVENAPLESSEPLASSSPPTEKEDTDVHSCAPPPRKEFPKKSDLSPKSSQKP